MTKNSKTLKTFEGFFHILYIPVVLVIRSSSFAPTPVPALPCHLPLPVPVLVPTCPCLPIADALLSVRRVEYFGTGSGEVLGVQNGVDVVGTEGLAEGTGEDLVVPFFRYQT